MDSDDPVKVAERALRDAEEAYRAEPSEANQRRIERAWIEVQKSRGEPRGGGVPFLYLSSRPEP